MNEEQYAAIREELAANQKEHESYNRRLREHDEKLEKLFTVHLNDQIGIRYDQDKSFGVENLRQSFNQIKSLTENIGEVKTSVQSMDRRLDVIEREPGDNWRKASWEIFKYVLLAIIAGVIGYVLKQ